MEIISEQRGFYTDDYASFGLRLVAYLIDSFIVGAVVAIIIGVFFGSALLSMGDEPSGAQLAVFIVTYVITIFGAMIGQWLYFALMESSRYQATLGKMAVGIVVTDLYGDPIGFGRATGRYFAKIISGMILCIGYIMAAFTEKKQALHDIIASTLVMNKSAVI